MSELAPIGSPLVSVIVPNFNHAEFLRERLTSIFNQSYTNFEVIILDDCSTDDSVSVIEQMISQFEGRVTFVPNEENAGNVFRQWRKGYELAAGELVWICESDDTAETDFLERMVPLFDDLATMVAFGRVQFMDENSTILHGLDQYREKAQPGIWSTGRSATAFRWFAEAFSILNIIPNVGGCLIRRQALEPAIWETAETYSILGDWYLYLELARGGKIAYENSAVTYFRQHSRNTSTQRTDVYYAEHHRVAEAIRARWSIPDDVTWRFFSQLRTQYEIGGGVEGADSLLDFFSLDSLLAAVPDRLHVLVGFLGFHVGGGEFFPIHLANILRQRGILVSMLQLDDSYVQPEMRELLDSRIPVYHGDDVRAVGPEQFLKDACIDLVHSHHIGIEGLFFLEHEISNPIPFVSSLHGSYEVSDIWEYGMSTICRGVQHWVFTAEKNTAHLDTREWLDAPRTKLGNAVPLSEAEWPRSRSEMGISDDTFVFCLVARPMPEKGWQDAIIATAELSDAGHDVALLLIGEGEYQEDLEKEWGHHPAIRFLGFQTAVHGLLRFSDCCLLPTRFPGESHPLIIIQAMQAGRPSIATAAGDIPTMLVDESSAAGLLIPWHESDRDYIEELKSAMTNVRQPHVVQELSAGALDRAPQYSMESVASDYISIYASVIERMSS